MTFVWNENAVVFSQLLKDYSRSLDRFAAAIPSVKDSQRSFDQAKEDLLAALSDNEISKTINTALTSLDESNVKAIAEAFDYDHPEFRQEMQIAADFGFSKNSFLKHFSAYNNKDVLKPVKSSEDLIVIINDFHDRFIEEINSSRSLKRKAKRKVKLHYVKAAKKTLLGIGCVGVNVYTATLPMSYFVALGFFDAASNDLIDKK